MGAFFKFILGLLVPPDPCPWDLVPGAQDQEKVEEVKRAMRRWQLGVFGGLTVSLGIILGSFFTPYGFALAGDTTDRTSEAVKPLAESVQKIEQRLKDNESANVQMISALNELRAVAVANNIDRLIRRRCIETDIDELQGLRRDIDQQKNVYQALAKAPYTEPSCTEVRR